MSTRNLNLSMATWMQVTLLLSYVTQTSCMSYGRVALPRILECFSCHTQNHGNSCLQIDPPYKDNQMTPVSTCSHEDNYCMARRYSFTNHQSEYRLYAMERKCVKECQTECVYVGERSQFKLGMCTSCCQESHCNFGSAASKTIVLPVVTILMVWVATIISFYNFP